MPEKKNQHFVPRCALKPFSLDGAGAAINLFNISRARPIPNAPVKGQCARDYLYGSADKGIEDKLAELEGHYARIVTHLNGGSNLSDVDKEWLLMFIFIQQRRTELAVQNIRDATSSMADAVFARAPEQRPVETQSDIQLMHFSLSMALAQLKYAVDLKMVVLRNSSPIDFITCDHPSALTNRFHLQKLHQNSFGISNSGAILLMPLTPRLSMMCYDKGVYTVPNASGTSFVELKRQDDVRAVNLIQYLSADRNIYFKNWDDVTLIALEMVQVSEKRTAAVAVSKVFVRDDDDGVETYRRGTVDEELTAKESLVMTSFRQPDPGSWPSVVKFREKPKTFNNGSAVGHVRKPEWLSGK
jgi:hypothetical protein